MKFSSPEERELFYRSLPMRGEWIEIGKLEELVLAALSLPMRGEWIEIASSLYSNDKLMVSPHAGRVD